MPQFRMPDFSDVKGGSSSTAPSSQQHLARRDRRRALADSINKYFKRSQEQARESLALYQRGRGAEGRKLRAEADVNRRRAIDFERQMTGFVPIRER